MEKQICLNCGKPIHWATHEGLYSHDYGRWEGDNGYYCYENDFEHSVNGNSREMQNLIDDGWYFIEGSENGWVRKNAKTGEIRLEKELFKEYNIPDENNW